MRLLAGLAAIALSAAAQTHPRQVAITIDDLPCANCAPLHPDGTPNPW